MTNIEKLTERFNALRHPRAVYNTLMVLASAIAEQEHDNLRERLLESVKEGESEHE